MANERLYQFPSKPTPVPADIIYVGDSANGFNEVNSTIAQIIAAYPNLSGIGGLTLGANTFPYVNGSSAFAAASVSALAISQLAVTGYTSTATAGATTTLTSASTQQQFFTGSTTQTVVLPVTSTLSLGQSFYIVNNSSGAVTVQSSGGNTVQVMGAGTNMLVTVILTSGTTAASWNVDYNFNQLIALPVSIVNGGTGVSSVTIAPTASAWAGWDANKNLSANNLLGAYATTATAAATTTLTVGSAYQQFFTGSTTQTVAMPVTSTLVIGQAYYIVNNSSGTVTVQSSGGNTIVAMAGSTTALLVCVSTSGTGAASWYADYAQSGLTLPISVANGGTGSASGVTASAVAANSGAGLPVQVQVAQSTTTAVTASSTFSNVTGLSITITPSASTSKILLRAILSIGLPPAELGFLRFFNGSAAIGVGTSVGSRTACTSAAIGASSDGTVSIAMEWLDSPATTSPITYTIQWANNSNSNNIFLNASPNDTNNAAHPRSVSTFSAMEIK